MQTAINPKPQKFCMNLQTHTLRDFCLCFTCTQLNIPASTVTFCKKCYPSKYKKHENHKDLNNFGSTYFKNKFQNFRHYLNMNSHQYRNCGNVYVINMLSGEQAAFHDVGFVGWLGQVKFWKFDQKNVDAHVEFFRNQLKIHVDRQRDNDDIDITKSMIEWGPIANPSKADPIKKMLQQSKIQKQNLLLQQQITQTLLQIQSSIQTSSKQQILPLVNKMIQKYPTSVLLLFMKLSLMELHSGNTGEWKPLLATLAKLKPELKSSSILLYLDSHQFWQKVGDGDVGGTGQFVDGDTGVVYKLSEPKAYLSAINNALLGDEKCEILLASKALGLIALGNYIQAQKLLQVAATNFNSQSFQMNSVFCKLQRNSEINLSAQLPDLPHHSKSYIINTIKLLKHLKKPKDILECCDALKSQGNQSTFSLVQEINAYCRLNMEKEARETFQGIQEQKLQKMGKTVTDRLKRKIMYCEGRAASEGADFGKAGDRVEKILRKKESASAYYSLASTKYNQECYEQAQMNINKALSLKTNTKYNLLKLYIQLNKKDLEGARETMAQLGRDNVHPKIYNLLAQDGQDGQDRQDRQNEQVMIGGGERWSDVM